MGVIEVELAKWANTLLSGFIQWGLPLVGSLGLLYVGYRLKPKTKKVVIPNRDVLFRAISEVQQASADLLMSQERLDKLEKRSPNLVHVDEMTTRDDMYAEYKEAIKKLGAEKMVAGKPFEALLSELIAYISTQVMTKIAKPSVFSGGSQQFRILTALEYIGRIAGKISEVTQKIDEISGQLAQVSVSTEVKSV